jgi:hypothetical protein
VGIGIGIGPCPRGRYNSKQEPRAAIIPTGSVRRAMGSASRGALDTCLLLCE